MPPSPDSGNMADAPAAITNGEVPIIISALSGLDGVKDEVYIKTVMNNLDTIINFPRDEILDKLESNDSENTLIELKRQLLPVAGNLFPSYIANKTPIDRRSKRLICKDIYILGKCIVERSALRELDSVYRNKDEPDEPQPRIEDLAETLTVVSELRQRLLTLEKDHADYKKKCDENTAELKSEINRMKAKCEQCNSAEDAQPILEEIPIERPNVAQEDEAPERREEENGLLIADNTQPEEREPHVPARPTITAAPKVVDLFIGNVGASYSCENIKTFMNTGTSLQVELKDIQEKTVRGDRKAFKVTVPHDKAQEAVSIWPKDITAERYMAPRIRIRPAKSSNTQARTNGNNRNNRNHTNNGNNRHSNSSGNNRNNNRGNAQNRDNGNNRNQRRQQSFQDQVQSRHGPPSIDQYYHPRGNFQYPIPSIPPIANQYWNQYTAPNWLPQPLFNL